MKHTLILIPDTHGRKFWKEAIPLVKAGSPAVFLGDYCDPYSREGISDKKALDNMKEIIDFARSNKDRVTLLLGNHDLSYFGVEAGLWSVFADRYSEQYSDCWHQLFWDNADLFSTCKSFKVRGRHFLMSHAGIHPEWVDCVPLFDDLDKNDLLAIAARIDDLFQQSLHSNTRTGFMEALSVVGYLRGGMFPAGSPVWADCHEYLDVDYDGITQIFGHTQQITIEETEDGITELPAKAYIARKNYCIDCRRCFFLDGIGQLRYLDTGEKM